MENQNLLQKKQILYCVRSSFLSWQKLVSKSAYPTYNYEQKFYYASLQTMDWFINDAQTLTRLFTYHAPPRCGKSECMTMYTIAYLMQRYSKRKALLITSNYLTLSDFANKIKLLLNDKANKAIFPEITFKIKQRPGKITFSNGSELIMATSKSEIPIGTGYHYIFLDDFMGYDEMLSEAKNFRLRTQMENVTRRESFDPKTKIFVNNQILGDNDISAYLIENYKRNNVNCITLRFMDYYDFDVSYKLPNGKFINFYQGEYLVNHFNEEHLKVQYTKLGNDESRIKNEYKSMPTARGSQIFNTALIKYYKYNDEAIDNIIKGCDYFGMCVDWAFSGKGDWTAFIMFAGDVDGNLYALDVNRSRAENKIDTIRVAEFYNKWKVKINRNFKIIMEDDKANIFPKTQLESYGIFNIELVHRRLSKEQRAFRVLSRYIKEKLYLPKNISTTDDLVREIAMFTGDKNQHAHDDLVDCIIDGLDYIGKP